jgi:phosphoglycolate phosphatase-like HAD superfamily hydrolase
VARLVARASELYCQEVAKMRAPQTGLREWLQALRTAGVPCAVTSALSRATVLAVLDAMDIRSFFQAVVTHEDGMESISQRFLSAAVKASTDWKSDQDPERCSMEKQVDGAGNPVVEGGGSHLPLFASEKPNVLERF